MSAERLDSRDDGILVQNSIGTRSGSAVLNAAPVQPAFYRAQKKGAQN
jgi:hypothetical protein